MSTETTAQLLERAYICGEEGTPSAWIDAIEDREIQVDAVAAYHEGVAERYALEDW